MKTEILTQNIQMLVDRQGFNNTHDYLLTKFLTCSTAKGLNRLIEITEVFAGLFDVGTSAHDRASALLESMKAEVKL